MEIPDALLPTGTDQDLLAVYNEHWDAIRSHTVTDRKVQDRFNYRLESLDVDELAPAMWSAYDIQEFAFKVNASYGFILRNTETGRTIYIYIFIFFHRSVSHIC